MRISFQNFLNVSVWTVVNLVAKHSWSALVRFNRAQRNLVNCFSSMTCMNKSWVPVNPTLPANQPEKHCLWSSIRDERTIAVPTQQILQPCWHRTVTARWSKKVVSSVPHLSHVDDRVARLAFLRPNYRNLAWKNGVWHVRHGLAFFWPFCTDGVGIKNVVWHFFETSGSVAAVDLELYNFFSGQWSSFSTTVAFSKIQAALPSKWRHRAKDMMMIDSFRGKTSKIAARLPLYSVLSSVDCAVFGK